MECFNELNFPSFEIDLELWQSGILQKWKPEDDWEWWWGAIEDYNLEIIEFSSAKLFSYEPAYDCKKFYAIPCPSLGETMERLLKSPTAIFADDLGYFCGGYFEETYSDTAPNAVAKGLMEVER